MRSGANSELSWLALNYVCGELSADEAATFEQRLEHDQVAREAVAEAVELAGAFAQLPVSDLDVLPLPRRLISRAVPRWAGLAAAVLLFAIGVRAFWLHSDGDAEARRFVVPTSALALAWSGVHEGEAEAETDNLLQWLDSPSVASDTQYVAALDASEATEAGVPDWMLEAASLGGGQAAEQPVRKEN